MHRAARRPPVRLAAATLVLIAALFAGPLAAVAGGGTPIASADPGGVAVVHGVPGPDIGLGGDAPPFAALTDLTAYLERDLGAPLPPSGQVIAPLTVTAARASFDLRLPIVPGGQGHAFAAGTPPVQVFSVNVHADLGGSPFLDPWEYSGWPSGYSSLLLESGTMDVSGGTVLVWAGAGGGSFPSGTGPDGRPLTADDPLGEVQPGWTAVTLEGAAYAFDRRQVVDLPVVSGFNGTRDLSGESWVAAFDALTAELAVRYPFTDLKGIDWPALVAEWRPQVEAAEADGDRDRWQAILMDLSVMVGDGHLAAAPSLPVLRERIGGSVGLTIGRTDQGALVVTGVTEGGPAARAGIVPGAVVIGWDGRLAADALDATALQRPVSTPAAATRQRVGLLPLGPVGSTPTVTWRNPSGVAETARLKRVTDDVSLLRFLGRDPGTIDGRVRQPVESWMLDTRTGYVRVSTFAVSPDLVTAGWDHAVTRLQGAGASALVLDLRGNPGGILNVATYVASSFVTAPVIAAEVDTADDAGRFGVAGRLTLRPNDALWTGRLAVLVDSGCVSACEVLAGILAANPDVVIAGTEGTAGVVATVGFWQLPGGVAFQAPTGRLSRGDETWLEGVGVAPTLDLPVTVSSLLSPDDHVLAAAWAAVR